jgi:hypothetical protein
MANKFHNADFKEYHKDMDKVEVKPIDDRAPQPANVTRLEKLTAAEKDYAREHIDGQ